MSQHPKPFHYEYIPARGEGHEYRVGDANDDVVCDFGTEGEAQTYVRDANGRTQTPSSWKF